MTNKEIKSEARQELALNIHQAIIVYTVEFALFITLVALIVMSCVCLRVSFASTPVVLPDAAAGETVAVATRPSAGVTAACVVMLCYGVVLLLALIVGSGVINYAMIDYYLASYRCKPYNMRRLGETIARCNVGNVVKLNIVRTLLGFLLLLCLIVPGVIYLSRTSMANHLLIANPSMKPSTALSASSKVMSGKTGAYFTLMISMIGWIMIGVITLGLGLVFVDPYINLVKTVYYKRNLQGDVGVYNYVPQGGPVDDSAIYGPAVDPQGYNAQPQARTVMPPLGDAPQSEPARPIQIEQPEMQIAPIGTLSDAEVQVMNETMRDFGAPEVELQSVSKETIVPEVVISPVTASKKTGASASSSRSGMKGTPVEDSDIVEIVNPLTTREADEANVFDRKVNNLYSGSGPQAEVKRDYFAMPQGDDPNDFVTMDQSGVYGDADRIEEIPVENAGTSSDNAIQSDTDSVMSDSAFADFIKNFDDVPTPQGKFKPLTRSKSIDIEELPPQQNDNKSARSARAQRPSYEHVQQQQRAAAQPQAQRETRQVKAENAEPQLSRTERARRAREERLKNL